MNQGKVIHYFNPGHETAVLNASKHYYPPSHVVKMQADLAFLPAWYASEGDFVFMETPLPDDFVRSCEPLNLSVKPVTPADFSENPEMFQHSVIDLWGISPQSIHFFEKLNLHRNLSLVIPQWKEEYRFLGSRFASRKLLAELLNCIPELEREILPRFVSDIETIEQQIAQSPESLLIKSPYSSSGRGLIWLPPGKLAQSERQVLTGMLKKQDQVSIEKVLNKQSDFSMHFENTAEGETRFIGYSIFQTNAKGAYEKSRLDRQDRLEKQITCRISSNLILQIRTILTKKIQEIYTPYYIGTVGVDMLIYQSDNSYRLHPCVEINMRKSMGYLAIRFTEKYLHPDSQGEFFMKFNSDFQNTTQNHRQLQKQYPLIIEDGRIRSGYFSLCPITDSTNYHAYIVAEKALRKNASYS
ncbi:MAG: hypothetical protein FWF53_10710 [Candidatus Azobacteroides sp.]|nr:hypothetical protein [Candidatus Azobacteroides sp.]